jgi:hypothetical protein
VRQPGFDGTSQEVYKASEGQACLMSMSPHVRERVACGEIQVQYCPTEDMLVDLFTRELVKPKHDEICKRLRLVHMGE